MAVASLAAAALLLYGTGLGRSPAYLHYDEIFFALHAHSIASTGHDLNGRFLPLYFYTVPVYWAQPIIIYTIALLLKFFPLSQELLRWPSAAVGVVDIVLTFAVARKLFARDDLALVAAALLAMTPAHFLHSRLAMDYVYPLPFLLGWLWCLLTYLESDREVVLVAGSCLLGIGLYSYIASLVMMPIYVGLTYVALFDAGKRSARPYVVASVGFAIWLVPLLLWALSHREVYAQYAIKYNLYDAKKLGPLQGLKELSNFTSLTERASVYYDYFNPSYLFFAGGANIVNTTRKAGVFLFPIAVFLPVGIWQLLKNGNRPVERLLLCGFFLAPLAATVVVDRYAIDRELEVVPFGILASTFGVAHLLRSHRRTVKLVALVLLALVPLQFYSYYRDYMTDYARRSGIWFGGNLRGAFELIMARDSRQRLNAVYLPLQVPFSDFQWKYYLLQDGRTDLLGRDRYYDPRTIDVSTIPETSIVLSFTGDASEGPFAASAHFHRVALVEEPGGNPIFALYERGHRSAESTGDASPGPPAAK